jgi:ribosomal protein L29
MMMLKKELAALRQLTPTELVDRLPVLARQLFTLRVQHKAMQLQDVSQIKKVKHQVAFIKLLLAQHELETVEG